MESAEALTKAAQILDEEKVRPTGSYVPKLGNDLGTNIAALARSFELYTERTTGSRLVQESPDKHRFDSTNHELMLALFSQVPRENRPAFIGFLLSRISEHSGYADTKPPDLRLTAEFCARAGYKKELIRAIGESELTQGLVSVLTQLEDTIALNFNLFSDEDLTQLAGILPPLKTRSHEYNVRVQFPSPLPDP